jgi:hypothetical protein
VNIDSNRKSSFQQPKQEECISLPVEEIKGEANRLDVADGTPLSTHDRTIGKY